MTALEKYILESNIITNKQVEDIVIKIIGNTIISKNLLEYMVVYVKSLLSIESCTHINT